MTKPQQITGNSIVLHDRTSMLSFVRQMVKKNNLLPIDGSRFLHSPFHFSRSIVTIYPFTGSQNVDFEIATYAVMIQWLDDVASGFHGVLDITSDPAEPRWIPLVFKIQSPPMTFDNIEEWISFFAADRLFAKKYMHSRFRGRFYSNETGKKQYVDAEDISSIVWSDEPVYAEACKAKYVEMQDRIGVHLRKFWSANPRDISEVTEDGE